MSPPPKVRLHCGSERAFGLVIMANEDQTRILVLLDPRSASGLDPAGRFMGYQIVIPLEYLEGGYVDFMHKRTVQVTSL